jgi:hypothetical protein
MDAVMSNKFKKIIESIGGAEALDNALSRLQSKTQMGYHHYETIDVDGQTYSVKIISSTSTE